MKVWRLTFKSVTPEGVVCINDLHFQTASTIGGTEPPASDILARLDTEFRALYRAVLAPSDQLLELALREEVTSTGVPAPGAEVTVAQNGLLGSALNDLPDGATLIVSKRTGIPLRSARGYIALPSPRSTAYLSARLWSGGYLTGAQALAAKLDDSYDIGALPAVTLNPVVYSRTRHERGDDQYTFKITSALARTAPRWRRSRTTAP